MEHIVFFPSPDGSPAFRRVPSLDEAVRLVEHLRNVEGIDSVSCHALTEVPLAFRPYYRVEVDAVPAAYAGEPHDEAVPMEAPYAEVPQVVEASAPEDAREAVAAGAQAASNGHRVAGANSLGFFA